MKKAVYYARVSTSLQEEKGTIESQKHELKKQIKKNGDVLADEYIDNGWSGARLDRPELDRLRDDLRTDKFEVVYFLDADRIARDSNHQNIIIAELLKYNKEIIIKGKNYIHNPDNKFTLTVLGAVNELEKAKIVERTMRGKRRKAERGLVVGTEAPFGYTYIKKTKEKEGEYIINEKESEIVKYIFDSYCKTDVSLEGMVVKLKDNEMKPRRGNRVWARSSIRRVLMNETYTGTTYYNRIEKVEIPDRPNNYAKYLKTRQKLRAKSDWIPIKVPITISKELYYEAQKKLLNNGSTYRGESPYLLSGLMKCGNCGYSYTGANYKGKQYYKCNKKNKRNKYDDADCSFKSIRGITIENALMRTVEEKVLRPSVIKKHIDLLSSSSRKKEKELKNKIELLEKKYGEIEKKREMVLDLYTDEKISDKNIYINKMNELDEQDSKIQGEIAEFKTELENLSNRSQINKSVSYFCKLAKRRLGKLDLEKKQQFLKVIFNKIIFYGDYAVAIGDIPIYPEAMLSRKPEHCLNLVN